IYSLGAILYEMITGELPYAGENVYKVMRAKTSEDPQPPSRYRPDLDPHLEEIILRAIERQPRNRYATAAEMLKDLENPGGVALRNRAAQLHPRSRRWMRFKRAAWGVGFFISLIGIFVLLIWLANRYPAAPTQSRRSYRAEVR